MLKRFMAAWTAFLGLMFGLAQQAHAELPSGVTAAITEAGADLKTAATAVIVAMIAFWALRKVGQKMGWW